jgi:transposase
MKPYSKDLRVRVLAAVDSGVPREEVAKTFSVSVPTIKRWLRRRRETGDVEPKPIPGRPRVKGAALDEWLPAQLQNNSDLTLEEHCARLSRKSWGWRSLALLWDGPSPVCLEDPGRSKKVKGSSRARRGGKGPVALAGFPL